MKRAFHRTSLITGNGFVEFLSLQAVTVCGLGGVGAQAALSLSRLGTGSLNLIDYDTYEETNINRQALATVDTVGKSKALVLAGHISLINPGCSVRAQQERITPENASSLVGKTDFVVDAVDDVRAKTVLISHALSKGIPVISSLGTANRLDATKLFFTTLDKTSGCPLARSLRKALRDSGLSLDIPVVASSENPRPVSGKFLGSTPHVPPAAGLLVCQHVMEHFLGEFRRANPDGL